MDDYAREQAVNLISQRRDELLEERNSVQRQKATLDARDLAIDRELADCVAAARVFGHALELPEEPEAFHYGVRRVRNKAGEWRTYRVRMPLLFGDSDSEKSEEEREEEERTQAPPRPKIKEIVLDRLRDAGEQGTKAAAIRAYIEQTYGKAIHSKTVGMTLYRLQKDGIAHRKGITWFSVSGCPETENPDAGTSGFTEIDL